MAANSVTEIFKTALTQITNLVANADENARSIMASQLRDLSYKIETQRDTLYRIGHSMLELPMARFAEDLDLFKILVDAKRPLSVKELAAKTGCDEGLLARTLRFLAAYGMVKETGQNEFGASNITETLALPGGKGMVYHLFDTAGQPCVALPEFAKDNGYKAIEDNTNCPWQKGHNTDLPGFPWLMNHPNLLEAFNQFMVLTNVGQSDWLDVYPIQKHLDAATPERTFMVDVGGGLGHQIAGLHKKFGDKIPADTLVLQDLPETINMIPDIPGVKKQAQDVFQPQQIKGAQIYYFRHFLHDWPDDKAVQILKNTKEAMAPDSTILLDEICAPNTNVNWAIVSQDIMLMVGAAARERTEDEWKELFDKAGFKLVKIHTYTPQMRHSVLELVQA